MSRKQMRATDDQTVSTCPHLWTIPLEDLRRQKLSYEEPQTGCWKARSFEPAGFPSHHAPGAWALSGPSLSSLSHHQAGGPGCQGLRHSPEAGAQGVLPGKAIFLLGELRAWHCVLARWGLAWQEARAAVRGTPRARHALWNMWDTGRCSTLVAVASRV